ncbi:MAG: hypothetical protein QME60_08400, partial [Verrucomicrobiota bacterium]|nr:hypothetical protein [Verrucomicrobiota bacterium]
AAVAGARSAAEAAEAASSAAATAAESAEQKAQADDMRACMKTQRYKQAGKSGTRKSTDGARK